MSPRLLFLPALSWLTASTLLCSPGVSLRCYGCNVDSGRGQGRGYVEVGCTKPEVINCSHAHTGFKQRFCITTYSTALDMVLTRGCATSRHCQQGELPGVSVGCCEWDLCNSATHWIQPATAATCWLLLWLPASLLL